MNRLLPVVCAGALTLTLACASRWPAQHIAMVPGTMTGDSALEGAYRWATLDGKAPPLEFPANSGRRLVYGTLELRNPMAARSGAGGTYALRFTEQPMNDTVRTTGSDGRFTLRGDTLFFMAAGRTSPDAYQYAWRPTGELALTDTANHVWVYARR